METRDFRGALISLIQELDSHAEEAEEFFPKSKNKREGYIDGIQFAFILANIFYERENKK